jgi:23S rRNA pseudouridine2605 synthase
MRIAHALATAGLGSRRKCEVLVTNGAVTVNGEVVQDLGRQVDLTKDTIAYRGKVLEAAPDVYYIMNKPEGYVVTAQDAHAKKTVYDLLPRQLVNSTRQGGRGRVRVFPVGRLDKDSMGILLLTNDGELSHRLLHPRYHVEKWYEVILDRAWRPEDSPRVLKGFHAFDGLLKLEQIRPISRRHVLVQLREGKKRQIRRVFSKFGYKVVTLIRISFGPIKVEGLRLGEGRYLTTFEAKTLRKAAGL